MGKAFTFINDNTVPTLSQCNATLRHPGFTISCTFLISAVGEKNRFPYRGWQNRNEETFDEGEIAPFRPILSPSRANNNILITPTKPHPFGRPTPSMTSRERAKLFQMQGETQSGSRDNSKFRENNVRDKLFLVRRKNEETQSVNSANQGNLLQIVKPNILSQNSDRKTDFEESNDNIFSRNINSSETNTNMRSQEESFSECNSTASLSRNDDVLTKAKGSNINVGLGSEYSESREDDSLSIRGQESDVTKSQTITPPNITNQIYSLPGANSNDANSDQNLLQDNRVSLFENPSQNSSSIIHPNTEHVSSATIFLPTAPPFSITNHRTEEQNIIEPTPASSSYGESTIIEAIFQQVDGLDQNNEVNVFHTQNAIYSAFVSFFTRDLSTILMVKQ